MMRPMLKACRPWGRPQPQYDLLDRRRVDVRVALEQLVDDEGAHLVRAELGERALEGAPDGRADGVDDHCFRHVSSPEWRKEAAAYHCYRRRFYLGGMRSAPSSRIGLAVQHRVLGDVAGQRGRIPRAGRAATGRAPARPAPGAPPRGGAASSGVSKRPGRDRAHADAEAGEVARRGQREAHHAALGGRVGGLPDLAVEGRDRGGHHHRAALAVRRRARRAAIAAAHSRSTLKVPIRFTRTTVSNGWSAAGPALAHGALGPADAGAGHRQADRRRRPPPWPPPPPRPRPRRSRRPGSAMASPPSSAASASARPRVQVDDGHARAARGQLARGGGAEARASAGHQRADSVQLHGAGRLPSRPRSGGRGHGEAEQRVVVGEEVVEPQAGGAQLARPPPRA